MMWDVDPVIVETGNYLSEQERWLRRRPICEICGEHIQEEEAVHIDGKWYCDECLEDCRECIED